MCCACLYSSVRLATSEVALASFTMPSNFLSHHLEKLLPCSESQPNSTFSQLSGSPLSPLQPISIAPFSPPLERLMYSPHSEVTILALIPILAQSDCSISAISLAFGL